MEENKEPRTEKLTITVQKNMVDLVKPVLTRIHGVVSVD